MKDRFTLGFLAGLVGWFPQLIFTQIMYWGFHLTKLQYLNMAAIVAFGKSPKTLVQYLFSELIVFLLFGLLGAIFSLLLKLIKSPNMHFKGILYGATMWFLIYSVTVMFKLQGIVGVVDFPTAIINFAGAAIYGLFMAVGYLILTKRYFESETRPVTHGHNYILSPSPAMKRDKRKIKFVKPHKID